MNSISLCCCHHTHPVPSSAQHYDDTQSMHAHSTHTIELPHATAIHKRVTSEDIDAFAATLPDQLKKYAYKGYE